MNDQNDQDLRLDETVDPAVDIHEDAPEFIDPPWKQQADSGQDDEAVEES